MCGLAPSRALGGLNFGSGGWEHAVIRVLPTGKVEVVTGTAPHGQGHETSWAMIVADRLGVPIDDIAVLHSDTAISHLGLDTYGSRSLAVGGSAIYAACEKVIAKARAIAAHQMEAAEEDLEFTDGEFRVRGTPSSALPIQAIAFGAFTAHNLPDGVEPNLTAEASYDPSNFTFPFGVHIAVVEVDEETGDVDLVRYVAVDDCGNQINPLIVEGQVHGGIVQGAAQALWEEATYDEQGQLRTPTLADYLVPSAAEVPSLELAHTVTPSPSNAMGVKGVGEAGTIAAAPAVINAVVDALAPLGVTSMEMPASPERVWQTIRAARTGANTAERNTGGVR
jgi:carbon-monoxide dehydrogenase large subunit